MTDEIKKHPFGGICFFIVLFLCVTYFLSFAFAFHDKYVRTRNPSTVEIGLFKDPVSGIGDVKIKTFENIKFNRKTYMISDGEGTIGTDEEANFKIMEATDEMRNGIYGESNVNILKDIINKIKEITAYKFIKIEIFGVSNVNIRAVDSYLNKEITILDKQIEFTCLQSNKTLYSKTNVSVENTNSADSPSCVEVSIAYLPEYSFLFQKRNSANEPCELDLLDYIYFTIYTITTTGYGDIIPATGHAKFIVSLANLFELFFIVILFNALLSFRNQNEIGQ